MQSTFMSQVFGYIELDTAPFMRVLGPAVLELQCSQNPILLKEIVSIALGHKNSTNSAPRGTVSVPFFLSRVCSLDFLTTLTLVLVKEPKQKKRTLLREII